MSNFYQHLTSKSFWESASAPKLSSNLFTQIDLSNISHTIPFVYNTWSWSWLQHCQILQASSEETRPVTGLRNNTSSRFSLGYRPSSLTRVGYGLRRNSDSFLEKHWHQFDAHKITSNALWAQECTTVAAFFFIFQGLAESLMFYADALHCNYRSQWSLLTFFAFYV